MKYCEKQNMASELCFTRFSTIHILSSCISSASEADVVGPSVRRISHPENERVNNRNNKYFAAIINHARLIFPTNAMVTHKKATTSRVNYWTVRWYPKRTLVRAPHVYLDQSALRILCDVSPRISPSRSDFVQVVLANFNSVCALFRTVYVLPVAIITIACNCSIQHRSYSIFVWHYRFSMTVLIFNNV